MYEPWPTCTVGDCAGIRLPGKRRCLAHAEAANRLLALAAITDGDPVDLRGVGLDARLLDHVVNALPLGMSGRRVWTRARLDGASILAADTPLDLSGHEFAESVSFRGLRAKRPVSMREISAEHAVFTGAAFAERLDARGAVFRGPARFDDAEFPGGLVVDGARFGQSCDLRRLIADDVSLTGATIGTYLDLSLANLVRLDMRHARVGWHLVFYAATVTEAAMDGIIIGEQVFGARARIAGWEPQPRRAVAGAQPADWRPVPVHTDPTLALDAVGAPWRPELLGGQDPAQVRWVTVEEWVGTASGGPSAGGTIGLQVCPWPTAGPAGRPRFDEDNTVLAAVDAVAFDALLTERLDVHRLRVGTVFAMRVAADRSLADDLSAAILDVPVDVTEAAREAAHAATMATVMTPLDPEADATLIGALAGDA